MIPDRHLPPEWPTPVKKYICWAARRYASWYSGALFTYPDNVQELALFYWTHKEKLPNNSKGLSLAFACYLRDLVSRDKKIRVLEPPGREPRTTSALPPSILTRELQRWARYEMWLTMFTEGEDD